jgi:LppP/LprE lipoprotein
LTRAAPVRDDRPVMEESRGGVGRWVARGMAILATAALLGVGVAVATMIRAEADSSAEDQALVAEPTPTPTATPKPEKRKAKRTLTKSQRAARRAAVAELRRQGYKPVRLADWHPRQTLRVLLGAQSSGGPRRAFFFVGRRYIGNDATTPSTKLRVGKQDKRSVTLVYSVWRRGDRACCPHGGAVRVRFRWEGGLLRPQSAIPDAAARRPAAA